jgi:hypothetical protein
LANQPGAFDTTLTPPGSRRERLTLCQTVSSSESSRQRDEPFIHLPKGLDFPEKRSSTNFLFRDCLENSQRALERPCVVALRQRNGAPGSLF